MLDRMDDNFDELLHPANAFGHPSEVVNDLDLTLNEKRAILASWASDACARKAHRCALKKSCKQANGDKYRRVLHRYISTVQPRRREQRPDPTAVVSIVLRVYRAY